MALATRRSRSGLDENGKWTPAFEGQRPPFEKGNKLQTRHDLFSKLTNEDDRAEVERVVEWLLDFVPADDPTFATPVASVVAGQLVRWSRANAYIVENGLEECSPALLHHIIPLENSLLRALRGLGLTPEGLSDLGLKVAYRDRARRSGRDIDPSTLPEEEQRVLKQAEAILVREGAL